MIPRPVLHVAAERSHGQDRLLVTGVMTTPFQRELEACGRTVGLAFRPAGFRPFITCPTSDLVDLTVPAELLLGVPDAEIAPRLLDPDLDLQDAGHELLAWFSRLAPEPDPMVDDLAALVEAAENDKTIWRGQAAG